MQHAIRVSDEKSVIITLKQEEQSQLTPRGLRPVLVTYANVFIAEGLKLLGGGVSIKAPEDAEDVAKGIKLALGNAFKRIPSISLEERREIYAAVLAADRQGQLRNPEEHVHSFDIETPGDIIDALSDVPFDVQSVPFYPTPMNDYGPFAMAASVPDATGCA